MWLAFVQPFATVLLGLGAAALAYRQWLTANEKLRLDLFDRRMEMAKAIAASIMDLQMHGPDQFEAIVASGTVERSLPLFGSREAQRSLLKLAKTYRPLWHATRRLSRLKWQSEGFDAATELQDNLVGQAISAHAASVRAIEPYMTFHARHYRIWR